MKIPASYTNSSSTNTSSREARSVSASPAERAWDAADAVRGLNHATLAVTGPRAGYRYPCDVDAVLGALQTLAERLPQALAQASAWLGDQHHHARIGHDHRPHRSRHPDRRHPALSVSGDVHTSTGTDVEDVDPPGGTGDAVACVQAGLDDAVRAADDLAEALSQARSASSHLTGVA